MGPIRHHQPKIEAHAAGHKDLTVHANIAGQK
jgi:hypothetical protein